MTFAPQSLKDLAAYIVSQGAVNLGIVGDTAHVTTGTSYHLGESQLTATAYSRITARDKAGLSEAASAIDIGKVEGSLKSLQALSNWLARECANRAIDTLDIRELIWSPDGSKVLRWDREGIPPTTGSESHLTHTHVSFYRDTEFVDKRAVFRRYFEEEDVQIKAVKGEEWKPTTSGTPPVSNGVFRAIPDRTAPIVERVGVDVVIRSIAEIDANGLSWRLTERMGTTLYMLRTDWVPLVPGGDPAVDKLLDDFIAGRDPCSALVKSAVATEYARVTAGTTATATITFPGPL